MKTKKDKPLKKRCVIYTDGSYRCKVEKGSWAALLVYGYEWLLISEAECNTTVNRMELTAVIRALERLTEPCVVSIISDSSLTVNIINKWLKSWKYNGFKTKEKKDVANQDLLIKLDVLMQIHTVTAIWVKAHTERKDPESCGNRVVDYFAQKMSL